MVFDVCKHVVHFVLFENTSNSYEINLIDLTLLLISFQHFLVLIFEEKNILILILENIVIFFEGLSKSDVFC